MKFLILLTLLCAAYGVELRPGLRTKFGIGPNRGADYYNAIPKTISEAKSFGWQQTPRPKGPMPQLVMFCPSGYQVCILVDDTGYIAGTQIAVNKNQFINATLDWKTQGYVEWTINGVTYWAMSQYFVDEAYLEKCREDRIKYRDPSKIVQTDAIYLTSFYGRLLRIPVDEKEICNTLFSSEACVPGMGHHYYYNVTNTVCKSDVILPWFILYYNGRLVASLWATYGQLPLQGNQQDRLERPDDKIIQTSFPTAPKCHIEMSKHTVSLHTWFIDNPWDVTCK